MAWPAAGLAGRLAEQPFAFLKTVTHLQLLVYWNGAAGPSGWQTGISNLCAGHHKPEAHLQPTALQGSCISEMHRMRNLRLQRGRIIKSPV